MTPASKSKKAITQKSKANGLCEYVRDAMENYFNDLDGHEACNLYELVLSQVEKPLLEVVMKNTRGNMSRAADILGMNRGTLRSRLKKYGLD